MAVLKTSSSRVLWTLALCAVLGPAARAEEGQSPPAALPEYVLKAGFLFNFAKYVEWPADAFPDAEAPLSIAVVGKDPFGETLENAFRNKTVKGRTFSIRRFATVDDLKSCHILFIPLSEMGPLARIQDRVKSWATLTVGESDGFCRSRGMISILIENDRPRLQVNLEATERAKLTIDTKLLKVAERVKADP